MDFNIEDFLPKYPNIINNGSLPEYMSPYDNNFTQAIYNKEEFNELKLSKREEKEEGEILYKHQRFIARFLSSHTIYNSILLVHEMGVGKTCSAFGATEEIRKTSNNYKGVVVVTKPSLIFNMMNDLAYKCTSGEYIPEGKKMTTKEHKIRLKKATSKFYSFKTFEIFAKDLSKESDENIISKYSNRIFVIDEVHNLRLHGKKEESMMYIQIHRLLHLIKNCKIILMSGTPMKDEPFEIASILNLILPLDQQLPTDKNFNDEYLSQKNEVYYVKDSKKLSLKKAMYGRVSYLKTMPSDVEIVYVGEIIPPLKIFNIVPSTMIEPQLNSYTEAFRLDSIEPSIYAKSRQSVLFVFPDGTYGEKGFKNFVSERNLKTTGLLGGKSAKNEYSLKSTLVNAIRGNSMQESLENLRKYSCVYANIIENILNNKDKLTFIYNSSVTGSGSILFGKILELFGFSHATGNETEKRKRYAVLTSKSATQFEIENIIERFNKKDNMTGDFIQVIIGSKKLSEGISLKNVQEIHVATPFWNYSELSQAIARGVRLSSHEDLLEAGLEPKVRIYRHCAITPNVQSIDMIRYLTSEKKDVSIKNIERLIKESAVDCALFFDRNFVDNAVDNSRDCDYQKCEYTCDGITNLNSQKDYSTYKLYYNNKNINNIINKLKLIFSEVFSISISELLAKDTFSLYEIFTTLRKIITENIPIVNKYGLISYLREENDVLFLVDNLSVGSDFNSSFYSKNPAILDPKESYFENVQSLYLSKIQERIEKAQSNEEISKNIIKLPETLQRLYIEGSLKSSTTCGQNILRYASVNRFNSSKTRYKLLGKEYCLKEDGTWEVCLEKEEVSKEPLLYPYIGLYNPEREIFCIQVVKDKQIKDPRTKTTGRNCMSYGVDEIIKIASELPIPYENESRNYKNIKSMSKSKLLEALSKFDYASSAYNKDSNIEHLRKLLYFVDSGKKKEYCGILKKWFADNNLLKESDECGKAGAKKK